MDLDGQLVTASDTELLQLRYDGTAQSLLADLSSPAGIAVLPDGDIAVADRFAHEVVLWDRDTGTTSRFSIANPNQIEVAPDGSLFVAAVFGDLYWLDPDTGAQHLVVNVPGLTVVSFNPTYDLLYLGTDSITRDIYTLPVYGPGSYGQVSLWLDGDTVLWGAFGMQVDRCGNVYVANGARSIHRYDPVTQARDLVVDPASFDGTYATMVGRFGSGVALPGTEIEEWDPMKLYVATHGEILEVDIGVPGKPRWPVPWP